MCTRHAKKLSEVFTYTVDREFLRGRDVLSNTMVLTPVYYYDYFYEDVYNSHLKDGLPERNGIKLVAFDLHDVKFNQFNRQLLLDAIFPRHWSHFYCSNSHDLHSFFCCHAFHSFLSHRFSYYLLISFTILSSV